MQINNISSCHHLCYLVLLLLALDSGEPVKAGEYTGALYYYYFIRQPSAKAEAMGRSSVATATDAFSCLYNPALISQNEGFCLSASYSSPYYLWDEASFSFIGITYDFKKYGSFGLCRYNFDYGVTLTATDEFGNIKGTESPSESMYILTYSHQLLASLYFGINVTYFYQRLDPANLMETEGTTLTRTAFPIDIGVLKTFTINKDKIFYHHFGIGTCLYNITNTNINYDPEGRPDILPQVFHIGMSYQLQLLSRITHFKLKMFDLLIQVEYQDVLNSKYYTGLKYGCEFSLVEMLSLRLGYYGETHNDGGYTDVNKNLITDLTYGIGLEIPVSNMFEIQLIRNVKFDMLVLKPPSYIKVFDDWEDYSIYNITVNFNL